MKKIILTSLVLLTLSAAQAQNPLSKGSINIDGSVGFSQAKSDDSDSKSTSFTISPTAYYFINSSLAVGGNATYSYHKNTHGDISTTSDSFRLGPGLMLIWPVQGRHVPYFSAGYNFQMSGEDNTSWNTTSLNLGILTFLNRHVALNTRATYYIRKTEYDADYMKISNTDKTFSTSIGVSVFINN